MSTLQQPRLARAAVARREDVIRRETRGRARFRLLFLLHELELCILLVQLLLFVFCFRVVSLFINSFAFSVQRFFIFALFIIDIFLKTFMHFQR